ncbi:ubiquitin-like protein [Dictyostelium discoideum AX4]|uniref:Ubiquitin-like protein NEDD8-like protein 2 n=1 Tax=Dictyostelium discoideum TaxID=44689 RepID=NED82_DICDI|nr:ubiquitin-like protein [Dictyostelium discoideum AX4]Q54L35.1 RecName: Full=NEDD8-like protein 2 [Dictyostelium discoideum]EAL63961.1 ubiquitin-like protein [Dictyostelium discoideum AX4]|eukprot:XP_637468.1 ubiquitin-like protein [Dictyostelium discoideum AX4]
MNINLQFHSTGKRTELNFDETDKIELIKNSIRIMEGINPQEQKLIFDGKVLKDTSTLKSCGIKDGSTISVLFEKSSNFLK